jgi:hypothetical protein
MSQGPLVPDLQERELVTTLGCRYSLANRRRVLATIHKGREGLLPQKGKWNRQTRTVLAEERVIRSQLRV